MFIDVKKKEEIRLSKDIIQVDDLIGETILTLLNKGYKLHNSTYHTNDLSSVVCLNIKNNELREIIENKKDTCNIIIDKQKDFLKYCSLNYGTTIGIFFSEKYTFLNTPKNFNSEEEKFGILICKRLNFYESVEDFDKRNRKSDSNILKELNEINENLLLWAKNLPNINKEREK